MATFESRRASVTRADLERMKTQPQYNYKEQAVRFLNIFWESPFISFKDDERKEEIWKAFNIFKKLDPQGENGHELDEFNSHRALESFDGALSVGEMRRLMSEIDLDGNHRMSLTEFLLFQYSIPWNLMQMGAVTSNSALSAAQTKLDDAQSQLQVAISASEKAAQDEEEAIQKEAAAHAAVEEVREAKEAQAQSLAAVEGEEKKIKDQIEALEARGSDETLGAVQRNKAKAELAQLKSQDSMPLRKSKIGLEAAVRRVTKAVKAAEADTVRASAARLEAEASRRTAEEAVVSAEGRFQEASEYLVYCKENVKSEGGTIWWMDRELQEARKYLPRSKFAKLEAEAEAAKAKLIA